VCSSDLSITLLVTNPSFSALSGHKSDTLKINLKVEEENKSNDSIINILIKDTLKINNKIEDIKVDEFKIEENKSNDSIIDILDIVSMINFILGYENPDTIEEIASDLNSDGIINIQDIIIIINIILN
jgi:predicted RND superfamily exporter protein